MKKIFIPIFTIILFFGIFGFVNLAKADIEFPNPLLYDTFGDLIGVIVNFVFTLVLVIAPLMIIIGAFYLLTAAGDPKKIDTGKNIILYTLIGLAIILFARGLVAVIESIIGVK